MVRVFYGEDTYRSRAAYAEARQAAALTARAPVTVLRDAPLTPAAFETAVEGQTLFGETPPLAVERLTAFTGAPAERIARALRRLRPVRPLLVWEDGIPSANGIVWRALQEVADSCEEFLPLAEPALLQWIQRRVAAAGRTIDRAAARQVTAACRGDLWCLAAELDKLATAAPRGALTTAEVDALTPLAPTADLFATVRALARGEGEEALRLLVAYQRAGQEPRRLFFLVLRELHALLRIRAALDGGARPSVWDTARELRLPRTAAEQLLVAARRTTTRELRALFDRCVVAYYHLNTGRADAAEILESLALGTLTTA